MNDRSVHNADGKIDEYFLNMYYEARETVIQSPSLDFTTASGAIRTGDAIVNYACGVGPPANGIKDYITACLQLTCYLQSLVSIAFALLDDEDESIQIEVVGFLGRMHSRVGDKSCRHELDRLANSASSSGRVRTHAAATLSLLDGDTKRYFEILSSAQLEQNESNEE